MYASLATSYLREYLKIYILSLVKLDHFAVEIHNFIGSAKIVVQEISLINKHFK